MKTALIIGASKGIGLALTKELLNNDSYSTVIASHRDSKELLRLFKEYENKLILIKINADDERSFDVLDKELEKLESLDLCINSIGTLTDNFTEPERQISEINQRSLEWSFKVNTIPSLIVAKKIKKLFRKSKKPIFASISAKVGSISDNKMGGWYSYRISKAALNMAVKNISIEFSRVNKNGLVVALHPGTTITDLSKPFLDGAKKKYQLHQPEGTAKNLLSVISNLDPSKDNGKLFSWNGEEIAP